jgi:hypothetical protein
MSLVFELAKPTAEPLRHRADVACFIGFVARRPQRPLPDALRAQLAAAGWVDGIWARPAAQVESLLNLPVALDSWDLFDHLFAWDERPLLEAGTRHCATYLGAAVRSFFQRGGRRAIVIRAGDPWPFLESGARRAALRRVRIRRLLPDFAERGAVAAPFEPHNPASWQGIHHLAGLRDVSLLVLPDLPDACTYEPPKPEVAPPPPVLPEGFVECSPDTPPPPDDDGLRHLPAPRLDSRGYAAWLLALRAASGFLADPRSRREVLLMAALPLPDLQAGRTIGAGGSSGRVHAQADLPAYLRRIGVLRDDGSAGDGAASAFVQLAWPWLRTRAALDLPEGLEPPDGVLAGLVAASATQRGSFRSVAGDFSLARLRDVGGAEPLPSVSPGDDGPTAKMALHLCVFAPQPEGWALLSDVTSSPAEAWRFGGASRLVSTVLRAARAAGEAMAFDPNGPALWARLRNSIEDLLLQFWHEGAFSGATAAEAFNVRCGRNTMTHADLDAGRLVVEIALRPAAAIERITVVLDLGNAARAEASVRESA